jgi:hypothetical protein
LLDTVLELQEPPQRFFRNLAQYLESIEQLLSGFAHRGQLSNQVRVELLRIRREGLRPVTVGCLAALGAAVLSRAPGVLRIELSAAPLTVARRKCVPHDKGFLADGPGRRKGDDARVS